MFHARKTQVLDHCVTAIRGLGASVARNLLAHAQHTVDLGDPEPVQNIRHEGLESHVFDAGDVFGPFEVVGCTIFSTFPRVVHHCIMLEAVDIVTLLVECF